MRVLIAGCGYVGCALGTLLVHEGHEVFGLRRNTSTLPKEIKSVAADLLALNPKDLPGDLDFVFYAVSPGGSGDEKYRAAYVDGPQNLLDALTSLHEKPRRFFFISSTRVYAQTEGEWVDETSPTRPGGYAGERLLEGESAVLGGPFPATVVRLSGIYGPGRERSIERGLEVPPENSPPSYTNRIHRDDCAGVLRHLMYLAEPDPLYLGVDHEPADRRTVAEWLSGRLGAQVREKAEQDASRRGTNKRCSNARLLRSGYEFIYPTFRDGFASLLERADG